MADDVTGARVEVTMAVTLSRDKAWDLVTDVSRYGEYSPECVHAAWLEPVPDEPRIGDAFVGRSVFGDGFRAETVCVVTEASRPDVFAWAVLDDAWDLSRPGSRWRYELLPGTASGEILLRHTFVHGPGRSGMREGAERDPHALERRLTRIRENITVTLGRMTGGCLIEESER